MRQDAARRVGQALALTHQYRARQFHNIKMVVGHRYARPTLHRKKKGCRKTGRAASDGYPIMTAAIKKAVGKKSVQEASYPSRKRHSRFSELVEAPKTPRKTA
jgi:hypothetical protein